MKKFFKKIASAGAAVPNFFKGIVVGIGAVAPGLSGSILLIIFGLYHKIVNAISTIFKSFKKNVLFLLPILGGAVLGVILFSKLVDFLLETFPMQTNFAFLGLVLGTIPMVFKEASKDGFYKRHYAMTAAAFVLGFVFFVLNGGLFPEVANPNFIKSLLLGFVVAAAYLVPGVDSFAILSTFGLYTLWVKSIADFDFSVLLPAAIGLILGAVLISLLFNKLFTKCYTGTYSVILGLFIAVVLNFVFKVFNVQFAFELFGMEIGNYIPDEKIPSMALNLQTIVSVILLVICFAASLAFSQLENIQNKLRYKKAEKKEQDENGVAS